VSGWLADQLPAYLTEDPLFGGFVGVFTTLANQTRAHTDALEHLADLDVTPGPMLRYLAQWLAFDGIDPALDDQRQRHLVAQLGAIVAGRGTRRGLTALLSLLTEEEVDVTDTAGGVGPPTKVVTVRVQNTAWLTSDQLHDLVLDEIPADCTLRLYVQGREVTTAPKVACRADHATD
jgi:phage tail-like protein